MTRRRAAVLPSILAAVALFAALASHRTDPPVVKPSAGVRPTEPPSEGQRAEPDVLVLERALSSLEGTDRPARLRSARILRETGVRNERGMERLVALLRDSSLGLPVRRAIAVVLGSLPGSRGKKEVFLALREDALAGLERSAVLALGIQSVEDGREFERDGLPYTVEAAEGLIVWVRNPIEEPDVRADAVSHLSGTDPAVRFAACLVLRDSTFAPEVREALLSRVRNEPDPEAAAEGAAALACWARQAAAQEEDRARIVARLTDAVPESDELFRFRLQAPFGEISMTTAEFERVRSFLDAADPDVRVFAAGVLSRRAARRPGAESETILRLARVLFEDRSEEVREAAALALSPAGGGEPARAALVRALQSDGGWEVRAAAARSLASHSGVDSANALRQAASTDPRIEVRQAATRALVSRDPR